MLRNYFPSIPTYRLYDHDTSTSDRQTDGRTDTGHTTCHGNTAQCIALRSIAMRRSRDGHGSGRIIILRKFGRSDRNILNAICEFCSFSGVSDRSFNEKSAKLTLAH